MSEPQYDIHWCESIAKATHNLRANPYPIKDESALIRNLVNGLKNGTVVAIVRVS